MIEYDYPTVKFGKEEISRNTTENHENHDLSVGIIGYKRNSFHFMQAI